MAVGEDEQQRPRLVVRLQLERQVDGVAQRRRAVPAIAPSAVADRRQVAGHRHAQIHDVRERDERRAVVGAQRGGQPVAGLHEMLQAIAGDALARVEHERHAERQLLEQ